MQLLTDDVWSLRTPILLERLSELEDSVRPPPTRLCRESQKGVIDEATL